MATRTVTSSSRTPVWRSTVVLKVAMAISGLVLVGYLVAHMYGNLKVFAGQEAFDEYAHHLRELGEPLLPYEGALWLIRIVLLAAIGVHIFSAVTLWRRSRAATGGKGSQRYASSKAPRGSQRSYASFTMRWGGVVIILFVIYHLMHFTWNTIAPGGASDSPYERVVNGFEIWWVVLSYTIALLAVGFHLRHGVWAALASLGANTSQRRRRNLNILATLVALVIMVGFLLPPFGIFFGLVG
ncbi:succinate dehydrogenase cytochrome b subunit [Ruania alkalisoli]|uniref:Succinate dehydrogenase cytochrome b subunit n=1 Tax=Ruania alkalisoli TaxID=2779775 RepID=A0A7M1SQ50_9MICO|nr:succinate dehydrogenase cytochrome b subunit [Ruania alkalisoli]QOR69688.1 succinate dehydrogenase cytochrome b subunit [Ruania alkalisoli]